MILEEDGIRLVHREETFNDLAVRELGESAALCACCLQFGRCTSADCVSCPTAISRNNCLEAMSDYDKLRFKGYFAKAYSKLSRRPDGFMRHKQFVQFNLFWATVGIVAMAVFVGFLVWGLSLYCSTAPLATCQDQVSRTTQNKIQYVLECVARRSQQDITGDGKFNCQDATILFYKFWNQLTEQYDAGDIEIVYTLNGPKAWKNDTYLNHVFVRVYDKYNSIYVDVEAQAKVLNFNNSTFMMNELWKIGRWAHNESYVYKPYNNIYTFQNELLSRERGQHFLTQDEINKFKSSSAKSVKSNSSNTKSAIELLEAAIEGAMKREELIKKR